MAWRRGLFLVFVAFVVLAGALVWRAMSLPSRQMRAAPFSTEIDAQGAAERLAHALRVPTVSTQTGPADPLVFRELHRALQQDFPGVHRTLHHETVADSSLLFTWAGSDIGKPPLLLLGHLDVVPVEAGTEGEWTHPPFGGVVQDGFVWGRGALDMKLTVVALLEAIERLVQEGFRPRRTVVLAFGHDEEIGGRAGATAIVKLLESRRIRPWLILDEGLAVLVGMVPGVKQPVANIGIAEKGYLSLELTAESEGGHASMPPRHTAVGILAGGIQRIEASPMPAHLTGPASAMFEYLAPELPLGARMVLGNLWLFSPLMVRQLDESPATRALIRTTIAPTMLHGSDKENVLPRRAHAVVNIRVHPSDRVDDAIVHVTRVLQEERIAVRRVGEPPTEPSGVSPTDDPAFHLLQRTVAEVFPEAVVAPGLVVGATDSRHYRALTERIYRFLPVPITSGDTLRIHGSDERVAIQDYGRAVAFYERLIRAGSGSDEIR